MGVGSSRIVKLSSTSSGCLREGGEELSTAAVPRIAGLGRKLITECLKGGFEILLVRTATVVVRVLKGTIPVIREPTVDLGLPVFREIEFTLQSPCRFTDVLERGVEFPLAVIALVQNWVFGNLYGNLVVGAECFVIRPRLKIRNENPSTWPTAQ